MTEKIYKTTGRKENLRFDKDRNQQFQNQYYDEWGQLRKKNEQLNNFKQKIGEGNVDGLFWTWVVQLDNATMTTTSDEVISSYIRFKWSKLEGVLGFTGKIDFVLKLDGKVVVNKHVDALVEFSGQWIGVRNLKSVEDCFPRQDNSNPMRQHGFNQNQNQKGCTIEFSFSMTPVFAFSPASNFISNFEKTQNTDAILEVDGNQLHVNKSFLSIHSEFFEKLFNSNFKEKTQSIIRIKDVDFVNFSKFLSLIYPNSAEITVEQVGSYLELADKYLMAAATQKCEEFLHQNKRIKNIQKIVFADKHDLNKLLRETLASVDSKEELEGLTLLPEFTSLSDSTKASLLHKFMHFIN
ncbi:hypothetical protein CRE_05452 [Caenorhabditis remanei]|uniref:BTB domain-containing protein n=1 Tax=Caenorhabditis remanei TaxID=31234 RepID=E3M0L2_CAERE|nr:hypothetical protein CRE_05452 [Caenorhabditis remanei]